jgi:hypothetical protein
MHQISGEHRNGGMIELHYIICGSR